MNTAVLLDALLDVRHSRATMAAQLQQTITDADRVEHTATTSRKPGQPRSSSSVRSRTPRQ